MRRLRRSNRARGAHTGCRSWKARCLLRKAVCKRRESASDETRFWRQNTVRFSKRIFCRCRSSCRRQPGTVSLKTAFPISGGFRWSGPAKTRPRSFSHRSCVRTRSMRSAARSGHFTHRRSRWRRICKRRRLPSRVLCSCCVRSTRRLQRKSGGESFWTFPIWSMRRLRFCTGRTEASARARGRLPRSTARFWSTSTRIPTRCRSASLRRCQRAGKTVFWSAT